MSADDRRKRARKRRKQPAEFKPDLESRIKGGQYQSARRTPEPYDPYYHGPRKPNIGFDIAANIAYGIGYGAYKAGQIAYTSVLKPAAKLAAKGFNAVEKTRSRRKAMQNTLLAGLIAAGLGGGLHMKPADYFKIRDYELQGRDSVKTENTTSSSTKAGNNIHKGEPGKHTINSLVKGHEGKVGITNHYNTGYSMIVRETQNIYPGMDKRDREFLVKYAAAIMWAESRGDPNAVSKTGVKGRMQVTESTAREMGEDRNNDRGNVRAGVKYLKKQLDSYGWNYPSRAFLGYKCGGDSVSNFVKYGLQYVDSENRNYLQRAEAQLKRLKVTEAFN